MDPFAKMGVIYHRGAGPAENACVNIIRINLVLIIRCFT